MFLNNLFKKREKIHSNPFALGYKDEWDLVVVSAEGRLYKKEFLARMLEGFDVEWVTEPMSENFSWHHARISLQGKILNIWDADTISDDNMADWGAVAEKIKNADVWIQLEYEGEPFPSYIIEKMIAEHLTFEGDYDIRSLRGILYRIEGAEECNRYAKAQVALADPNTPVETKNKLAMKIDSDWSVACLALLDYKYICENDSELKSRIIEMLQNSESNIKVDDQP